MEFGLVMKYRVFEKTMKVNGSKATPIGDTSVNTLKLTVDVHFPFIVNIINMIAKKVFFPDKKKLVEGFEK